MNTAYCLPIIKSSQQEVLQTFEANKNDYTFFEIWLDYIEDLSLNFIDLLVAKKDTQLILLFRRQQLETPLMAKSLIHDILQKVHETTIVIDVDIKAQADIVDYIAKEKLQIPLILSYHNYASTPSEKELREIISQMEKYNPYIYKVSTYCQQKEDALRILMLLLDLKKKQKRCIMLGMGEHGMITRVFGTLWGNEMIFAPQKIQEASAPGQITRHALEEILGLLTRKENI